jgi:hypothetical protein
MRSWYLAAILTLSLGGCVSYSAPPQHETVVLTPGVAAPGTSTTTTTILPPGTVVVCANGLRPPC